MVCLSGWIFKVPAILVALPKLQSCCPFLAWCHPGAIGHCGVPRNEQVRWQSFGRCLAIFWRNQFGQQLSEKLPTSHSSSCPQAPPSLTLISPQLVTTAHSKYCCYSDVASLKEYFSCRHFATDRQICLSCPELEFGQPILPSSEQLTLEGQSIWPLEFVRSRRYIFQDSFTVFAWLSSLD